MRLRPLCYRLERTVVYKQNRTTATVLCGAAERLLLDRALCSRPYYSYSTPWRGGAAAAGPGAMRGARLAARTRARAMIDGALQETLYSRAALTTAAPPLPLVYPLHVQQDLTAHH
ncbi:hypothetical protein J6590_012000 [Homalodisca vitripennis]|nr:hypothetical protein J6590_012000 [Homalodisca vitripennis]